MSWPDGERFLRPLQSFVLSLLLSLVSTLNLSSGWRRTVSSKFSDTQVSSISTEELVLLCHARCVLSRLRCNGHSLLLSSYQFRIGRIKNPSCSACGHPFKDTSHLILHCPVADSLRRSLLGNSLSLYDLWSWSMGISRFWGSMVFRHAPIPGKRSGNNNSKIEIAVVNRITSHSATCYHKIQLLTIYKHGIPLHIKI